MSGSSGVSAIEAATMARVSRRLIPFLILCYFIAYLDRVNVGFAALEMNRALGLTPTVYAWGAGIFFLAFFLFEVPSNVILERVGARRWIARIMITWGILSGCMALCRGRGASTWSASCSAWRRPASSLASSCT